VLDGLWQGRAQERKRSVVTDDAWTTLKPPNQHRTSFLIKLAAVAEAGVTIVYLVDLEQASWIQANEESKLILQDFEKSMPTAT
jgi:hypothetical protein